MNEKTLTGEDVLMIVKTIISREYKSETDGYKGKKYQIYAFGANAFAVHQDSDFHKDFADGNIKSVMLTVTEDGWSLANHLTWNKAIAQKRHQVAFDCISAENVRVTVADMENAII